MVATNLTETLALSGVTDCGPQKHRVTDLQSALHLSTISEQVHTLIRFIR